MNLKTQDAPITLNGVVYNEMKGAFSSPEGSARPGNYYEFSFPGYALISNESGGDPKCIPELTYEALSGFP